ncbi:DoxX family protein [Corynebacterium auriscanis]|uniref:DoxX family protein n=1 Tax=Corynebacterium auriscanis TaxID=99807 RepID=UPI00224520B2|nr:DoxX family membrane protein [Corynebacterium auriscanis]MCX2162706.1 DoxX family membrane protein [Corynebacterium auriscanis]
MPKTTTHSPHPLHSIATLLGRIILGVVLIAHGWQKLKTWGPEQTQSNFDQMGAPMPEVTSQIATWVELVGGILIILGLLVRFVGPILFVHMVGAVIIAHRSNGIFVQDSGWELAGVIGAAGLFLAAAGAGAFSLDHLFTAPFRARRARKERERNQEAAAQTPFPGYDNNLHAANPAVNPTTSTAASTANPTTGYGSVPATNNNFPAGSSATGNDNTATEVFRTPHNGQNNLDR